MRGSWFRFLSYQKERMVCNETGLIVRYIPLTPVVEIWGLRQYRIHYIGFTSDNKKNKERYGATPLDKLQTTPSGMPQATPPGMPQATPPAILFQISKIFNFSNNLPQATPPASPQAIFEKNFALGPCLQQF
ncbi:hypothetical protein T06_5568 [Trichinella sp. T6]|nr:hypothetical protein T06_5568 [Trichinella sp. T6]KRX80655.1 hypothetical protein T06_5568 [Trichinella sp. T6]